MWICILNIMIYMIDFDIRRHGRLVDFNSDNLFEIMILNLIMNGI